MKLLSVVLLALIGASPLPLLANVTVSSPTNGATVGLQVHYAATSSAATCPGGVATTGIYVDNSLVFFEDGNTLSKDITLTPGSHHTVVQEWDYCGGASTTTIDLKVVSQSAVTVSSPPDKSTVSSPATYTATAAAPGCAKGVASTGIYVDNQLAYVTAGPSLNTSLSLNPGPHHTAVQEWDYCGGATFTPVDITVQPNQTCPTVAIAVAGPQPFPPPPPSPAPNPGTTAAGSVCVSSPINGAQVTSPMTLTAVAALQQAPIASMRVYIDGHADYFTFYNQFTGLFWMPVGTHTLEVIATDTNGSNVSNTFSVNVTGTAFETVINTQSIPDWEPCSDLYDPGTSRAGQICAAGNGNAVSTMTEGVASPSLSGSSAHFTMGGPTGYSNELYTQNLGGGDTPTHFVYDFYVLVDNPAAVQALEFDVNQTIDNTRWVFGTECNFNGNYPNVGEWDIWDGSSSGGWVKTAAPCPAFAANQWVHVVWTFERVGQQVHYVYLQVDDKGYPLNTYLSAQPNWSMGQINVAFQMDGNYNQTPYNVWFDKASLTVY